MNPDQMPRNETTATRSLNINVPEVTGKQIRAAWRHYEAGLITLQEYRHVINQLADLSVTLDNIYGKARAAQAVYNDLPGYIRDTMED